MAATIPLTVQDVMERAIERASTKFISPNRYDYEATPSVTDADGITTFPLHEGQLRAWSSTKRFVAIFAGWQSGKTVLGPWWLLREMQRRGPGDYAVIAPHDPMLKNKAKPELERVFKGLYHSSGNEWHINAEGAERIWGDPNAQGRVIFRHARAPEAIEAFTAKAIWIEEPGQIEDEVWKSIKPRGAVHQARMLFTSRPYEHNWYVRELWQMVKDENGHDKEDPAPHIEVVNFRSIDNPSFPVEEYEAESKVLQDWEFAMRYDGIPTRPAGLVYDAFGPANIYDHATVFPDGIPAEWPLWLGLDFGNINTAGVLIAEEMKWDAFRGRWTDQPTGEFYLFATYHAKEQKTARDHLKACREIADAFIQGGQSQKPTAYGGSHQEDGWRESYALSGVAVIEPLTPKVEVQISCAYAGFKTRKLRVSAFCKNLITDLGRFSYELDDDGYPTHKLKDEVKYHVLAGLRYVSTRIFRRADVANTDPELTR